MGSNQAGKPDVRLMTPWKELALNAYYLATLPTRRRAARDRTARQAEPVRVLFYHRVADEYPNAWTMPTQMFASQIRWLKDHFDIVTLEESQARIAAGRNRLPTACITFDDGYADNMRFAVPLLLDQNVPFTYFVSTDFIRNNHAFPHDQAVGLPLVPNTPEQIRQMAAAGVEIGGHTRSHADLGGNLTPAELANEIVGCKGDLEEIVEREVRYFAFPYGLSRNISPAAFRMAHEAGYHGVCSAYGGYNFPGDDEFHLRRFHADEQFIRFKNWMTIDPRKLRMQEDFNPGDYRDTLIVASHTDAETQSITV